MERRGGEPGGRRGKIEGLDKGRRRMRLREGTRRWDGKKRREKGAKTPPGIARPSSSPLQPSPLGSTSLTAGNRHLITSRPLCGGIGAFLLQG